MSGGAAPTGKAGRRCLITGGASGFGLEIARHIVSDGGRVALLDRDEEGVERATRELGKAAIGVPGDVRSATQVRRAVKRAATLLSGLDSLVISAGVIHIKPLDEVTGAEWDRTLDINLKGAFLVAQAAAPHLRSTRRGRIVAISSDAGRRGFARIQAYTASKFGLIGLVESLAVELADDQVTVNAVCPVGVPTTGMGRQVLSWKMRHSGLPAEQVERSAARTNPLGRNATESDVAAAVRFLLSDDAAFITGVALDVDGGAHLGFLPGA